MTERANQEPAYSFQAHRLSDATGNYDAFWAGLEEGALRLHRCAACKVWIWPVEERCGECGSWEQEWVEVEPRGSIWGWTRVQEGTEFFRERNEDLPYIVVCAEVGGTDGPRVFGVLKGSDTGLRVGAPVYGTIDPPSGKTNGYASIRWSLA